MLSGEEYARLRQVHKLSFSIHEVGAQGLHLSPQSSFQNFDIKLRAVESGYVHISSEGYFSVDMTTFVCICVGGMGGTEVNIA